MAIKQFGNVVDEAVSQLKEKVRVLETQRQTLTINIRDLESKRDKLSETIAKLEEEHTVLVKKCGNEIDAMMKSAKEKLDRASSKDAEASGKVSELNEKLKEAENLITSNQGKQKGLDIQNESLKNKISKLKSLIDINKKTIEGL